jgi:hypothetical protein
VIDQPQIDDANVMFDHLRDRFQKSKGWLGWSRRQNVETEVQKLRYLLACLEESARIHGLKLMIGSIHEKNESLSKLIDKVRDWKIDQIKKEASGNAPLVYAYPFEK